MARREQVSETMKPDGNPLVKLKREVNCKVVRMAPRPAL
jgi:hypothetical protein